MDIEEKRTNQVLACLHLIPPENPDDWAVSMIDFWKALCDDHGVPFTLPLTFRSKRTLVEKLMRKYDPIRERFSEVQGMSEAVLTGELQTLVAKHILTERTVQPKEQRYLDGQERRLRAFALFAVEKSKTGGKYHWNEKAAARKILKENPELAPHSQTFSESSREDALLSQYRKDCADVARHQTEKDAFLSEHWDAFTSQLDVQTQVWIIRLSKQLHERLALADNDAEKRAVVFREWKIMAACILPPSVLREYVELGMPFREAQIIAGLYLQERAEANRRQYYRPSK